MRTYRLCPVCGVDRYVRIDGRFGSHSLPPVREQRSIYRKAVLRLNPITRNIQAREAWEHFITTGRLNGKEVKLPLGEEAPKKARCPYCRKRVTLTKSGKLHAHNDPATGTRCARSGGSPS